MAMAQNWMSNKLSVWLRTYTTKPAVPIEGQIAVAQVTMNRVKHGNWPNNICDVVYEKKQFSWTWLEKDQTPNDPVAFKRAVVVARDVMIGNVVDPTHGATFYHAAYVNPDWNQYMEVTETTPNPWANSLPRGRPPSLAQGTGRRAR